MILSLSSLYIWKEHEVLKKELKQLDSHKIIEIHKKIS